MELELLVAGGGAPVTVAAHGLGASLAETRPLLGGVPGTRVLYAARGHGGSPLPAGPFDYRALGEDLEQVADAHAATRALGVSMGAGALLSLLARRPDRFARVVLFLPAAIDRPRTDEAVRRVAALAAALDAGDRDAVERLVLEELPADLRDQPAVTAYVRTRTSYLFASPGVAVALRALPDVTPVDDAAGWRRSPRTCCCSRRRGTRCTRRRSRATSRRCCRGHGWWCSTSRGWCSASGPGCARRWPASSPPSRASGGCAAAREPGRRPAPARRG